ncbi:hypothetical protein NSA23_06540 [Anaerosalibacter massiliensis]|uniref:Uncharacterized protein n=1 Tax=Anaerosalibacter massiliensis TaxID=1347392 RepID=A0A9X2MME4_9FIRM|nr:hypothetical protein [Anaerosalibacter massiliensis]MCR2043776.1 hypothetical protein [Anaerosalibacter massiliensis]
MVYNLNKFLVSFSAKESLGLHDIIIVLSRHVETVVSLSHKNADTHININVEFGDEEGQIPVHKIAQKAELV